MSLRTKKDADTVSASPSDAPAPWSLRRRMAVTVSSAAFVVFALLGLLVYRGVEQSSARQFDEALQREGYVTLRYADHEYQEGEALVPDIGGEERAPSSFKVVYQIATHDDRLLYRSPGAPAVPLARGAATGYSVVKLAQGNWRVYSVSSAVTPLVVHVAEPLEYRTALVSRALRALAVPLIFALVLLTLLIALVTERAFRPLRRMARDLASRSADDPVPVNTREMPIETFALGVALNGLLARQAEVLARERRFTADAAHELRTPLAALRAQAQLAARAATPEEARRPLVQLQAGIDRTAHLVSQLLDLTRIEPGCAPVVQRSTVAAEVIELVIADLAAVARHRRVAVTVKTCEGSVPGAFEVLYLLIRNLLENAIQHAIAGGRVTLEMRRDANYAVLAIEDDGPGVPATERERVFERFYRIPGGPPSGSGLGLSVVKRVVEILSGSIELSDPASRSGLLVTIRLPLFNPSSGAYASSENSAYSDGDQPKRRSMTQDAWRTSTVTIAGEEP
jgi:signal transduction histidine kinase